MAELRSGYTTGTCAAAAAKAAALLLCGNAPPQSVEIALPDGTRTSFPVFFARFAGEGCEAAVRKQAGDDPDATDDVYVTVHVCFRSADGIHFTAGEGVGTVTKPGLSIPPGEPAINPVPRRMICSALADVTSRGLEVRVSIPGGREIAERTFNPRLGIVGGLSILGTTGRVRPFSVPALVDSLKCSLSVAAACGVKAPVLVPGNIGERAARRNFRLSAEQVVHVGNYWGSMLDEIGRYDFDGILVLGHPGKLAKLTKGEWDTHSGNSQSAVPIVARLGSKTLQRPIPASVTVEGIFKSLKEGESRKLADALASEIRISVSRRLGGSPETAAAIINMNGDILGQNGDLSLWN
jgi:cobalt-precorrin-5B (C1)-methyltransferase